MFIEQNRAPRDGLIYTSTNPLYIGAVLGYAVKKYSKEKSYS